MDAFTAIVQALNIAQVRFIVMGVWGINHYARASGTVFTTEDRDLFLPPDADNLVRAWNAAENLGYSLWAGNEPLDKPRDLIIAKRIVEFRAVTTAISEDGLQVDLSLVMAGFEFDDVWSRRRIFTIDGVEIPVASLADIVQSKANAGRDKDRLFLAMYQDKLRELGLEDE